MLYKINMFMYSKYVKYVKYTMISLILTFPTACISQLPEAMDTVFEAANAYVSQRDREK